MIAGATTFLLKAIPFGVSNANLITTLTNSGSIGCGNGGASHTRTQGREGGGGGAGVSNAGTIASLTNGGSRLTLQVMAAEGRRGDDWPTGTSGKPYFGSHWNAGFRPDSGQFRGDPCSALRPEQSPLKQVIEF